MSENLNEDMVINYINTIAKRRNINVVLQLYKVYDDGEVVIDFYNTVEPIYYRETTTIAKVINYNRSIKIQSLYDY